MKILVVSDTHGKHENLEKVLERVAPIDLLIHLGDAEGYEDHIADMAVCPIEIVAGNPVIDDDKCENCGICSYVCSRNLISERIVPEHNYLQMDALRIDMAKKGERKW